MTDKNNGDADIAQPIDPDKAPTITFAELGLAPKIQKAIEDIGYERPTPIQAGAIPAALQGQDVLGIAQTGTGKTGAFTLPVLHRMSKGRARARMPRCLIVCPTRELAAQVAENVELYGKYMKIEMALLIGGVSFAEQEIKLSRGVDVLIATPGRLLDQFERGKILLTGVQALVVDEADRMLDMGFIPDIEKIFKLTPFTRQVLFFSATMPNEIKRLVDQFLHRPFQIEIARKDKTAKTVTQRIVRMPHNDSKPKRTALRWLIDNNEIENAIVFCNRKRDVDIVAKSLQVHGHIAEPIHGDLPQSVRTQTLERFRNGEIKVLVASDVAARGLDVASVSHVFNYDVPVHSEDYVHRIGRTGRAGRKGDAISLVTPLDGQAYDAVLRLINKDDLPEVEIPGLADFERGEGRRPGRGRGRNERGRGRGRSGAREGAKRGRKSYSKDRDEDNQQSEKPAKAKKAKPKTEKPKKDSSDTQRAKSERTDKNERASKSKPSKKSNAQSDFKRKDGDKKRRHKSDLPKNDVSGFGDNVPSFFGTGLK